MQVSEETLKLIGEFTYRFLRLERSLVDREYYYTGRNGFVFPNFKKYVQELLEEKMAGCGFQTQFLELKKPLKKRVKMDSAIDWSDHAAESNGPLDYLLKVDMVRDNLFHGSKVLDEKDRDISLLRESINFLKMVADFDENYQKSL